MFVGYAFVSDPMIAVVLYVVDHTLFSINHITAVILPVLYGVLWIKSPMQVFIMGAILAGISLLLARLVPRDPQEGNEVLSFQIRA